MKCAILLISSAFRFSLGMERKLRALRVLYTRTAKKVIFFIVAITSLYITWEIQYTIRNIWLILGFQENDLLDFNQQWCKMHRWRVDWEGMFKPCRGQEAWELRQVNSKWRTDGKMSFIKKWEIQPAGEKNRIIKYKHTYEKHKHT